MNSYGFVYFLIVSHASADNSICCLNLDKKSNNELDIYVVVTYSGKVVGSGSCSGSCSCSGSGL